MNRGCVLLLSLFFLYGCIASALLGNSENETPAKSADTFYKLMMWKYYERAAPFVHPEKVSIFDDVILKNKDDLNITSYEIRELVLLDPDDKKESTEVKVVITYYKYPSVSEKTLILRDLWIKEDNNWYLKSDFDSDIYN